MNFKAARKKLELHLDDAQDNPRIWELYGNVLKKLGKTDKARTAFLHRDELRRDDLAFERLADNEVENEDLDYLYEQQQAFTYEQYVYGMEDSVNSIPEEHLSSPKSKFGSVLTRTSANRTNHKNQTDKFPDPQSIDNKFTDWPNEAKTLEVSDSEEIELTQNHREEESVFGESDFDRPDAILDVIAEQYLAANENALFEQIHDDDYFDYTAVLIESDQPVLSLFSDETYSFDPDEFTQESNLEDSIFSIGERITFEQRAEQLAAVFIHKHDWPKSTLDMLTHIFAVKAYGPVVKFLNHYAEIGMQPAQLQLARSLRDIWQQLPKYWISFHRNGDSAASYCNFSWSQSLRFVALITGRQHGGLDEDVLLENLEIMYEQWFNSRLLRKSYKSFSTYLNATMDQIEKDDVLVENEAGFGRLDEAREQHYSDLGDTDLFDHQLIAELEFYGYSFDRSAFRAMQCCEDVIYDDAFYNQHRILLADAPDKDDKDE
jgi:hypothetical protein